MASQKRRKQNLKVVCVSANILIYVRSKKRHGEEMISVAYLGSEQRK